MAHKGAQRIRNIAIVGHRGSGKTSLNEALLFEAGVINRLGSVADGTTVSDSEPDEQEREMSIAAQPLVVRARGPQDQPDRHARATPASSPTPLAALSVCESAVFVRQRRDGRRGLDRPPLAAGARSAGWRASCS